MKIDGSHGAGKGVLPLGHIPKKVEIAEDDRKLSEACRNFEAIFLHYLLSTMRESIPKSGLFKTGAGERVFRDMMDEALSKRVSERGGVGIARMVYKYLKKLPERTDREKTISKDLRNYTDVYTKT